MFAVLGYIDWVTAVWSCRVRVGPVATVQYRPSGSGTQTALTDTKIISGNK